MATLDIADISAVALHTQLGPLRKLVNQYHADPGFRRQVETDPLTAFREYGLDLPDNITVRVVANTRHKRYIVLPPDPNTELRDELLGVMAGGDTAGSAGTASTVGTFAPSCGSTFGSALTAGTAGSSG